MHDWRMAVHYRNRAELLRGFAEEATQKDHSKALRSVAEYYDALADALERNSRIKS